MIVVKRGDTHPISFQVNADLAGATVVVKARKVNGGSVVTLSSSITSASSGIVTHTLTGTLAVGVYDVELEITKSGAITTAPSRGYIALEVQQDLI